MFQQKDVSMGAWFVFGILSAIPLVNLITWLILLFDGNTNKSLKNLLKLQVVLFFIGVGLVILLWGSIFALIGSA
jgi:hypothetical protein